MTRVIVFQQGTTLGQALSDSWLLRSLRGFEGLRVDVLPFRPVQRRRPFGRQLFVDLREAASARRALRRSSIAVGRGVAFVVPSTTLALLLPRAVLRRSVIRFDALACENRPGPWGLPLRLLERRSIRLAACLAPYSLLPSIGKPRESLLAGRVVIPLPSPAQRAPSVPVRDPYRVVAYCANRHKKGLDIVLRAWALAVKPAGAHLILVGVDAEDARACAHDMGVDLEGDLELRGRVPHGELLATMASSSMFLAGARYEDFGITPLEAMASGLLLVTTESAGPFEAGRLIKSVAPNLLAPSKAPQLLADRLSAAFLLSGDEVVRLRRAAVVSASPYAPKAVGQILREQLIPQIERIASAERADC